MPQLLWDASGLAKRYAVESGTPVVMALWSLLPASRMKATFPGYAEVYWILLRKRNRLDISEATYQTAQYLLHREVVADHDFTLLDTATADVLASIALMEKHSLNSSDAAMLSTFLRYARTMGETCVLVAADGRFCRAARAEGLVALNPEVLLPVEVPAFLNAL